MQKYSVYVDGFINEFQTFESGETCCIRHQNGEGSEWLQTDVSGSFWAFAVFDVEPGNFSFFMKIRELQSMGS